MTISEATKLSPARTVAVVETGSIVAASARLNLTQPGVTRRIPNLEEMLGAQLLDRL
ncbi:LysR family transcriptional regulator, partial [Bradyrhizobium brasilense]|uniref:helix-turn-helix domain-containing protein n=1 Tax=Bradyrhizobium brasilense TaxID=1419277 RepID=UPI001456B2BE